MYDTSLVRARPSNRLIAIVDTVVGSDNFDRPDGPLGANWSAIFGGVALATISAQQFLMAALVGEGGLWNVLLSQDQFVQGKYISTGPGTVWFLLLRATPPGGPQPGATPFGYGFTVQGFNTGPGNNIPTFTDFTGGFFDAGPAMGDSPVGTVFRFEAIGPKLFAYRNGVLIHSTTAPAIGAAGGAPDGYAGIFSGFVPLVDIRFDDFSCGAIGPAIL